MTARSFRTWCSARLAGAALAAVCIAAGLPAVAAVAAEDAGVREATVHVQEATSRVDELRTALDATAAHYERANAHRIRLQDEIAAADAQLEQANAAVAQAQTQLGNQVADAYKHPAGDMSLGALPDALLDAPDAPTALHRAALYRRMVSRSAESVERAQWTSDLTHTDIRQEHIVAAGAKASVDEWRRQSHALTALLRAARDDVASAQDGLAAARSEAARRAAEKARLEQQLQTAAVPAAPAAASPAVKGRVCPVGTPNGFIDSWHFPRPGGRLHEGVDMFAPYGTPLYAVADGVIYRVYNNPLGGLSINLVDKAGNMYFYTHLSAASVETGQQVRAGHVIGAVGTSGNAAGTPPHLHWQFHPGNGEPINPYPLAYALCR